MIKKDDWIGKEEETTIEHEVVDILSPIESAEEFGTSHMVVKTIVRILKPEEGDRIYEIIMQRLIQFNDSRKMSPLAG